MKTPDWTWKNTRLWEKAGSFYDKSIAVNSEYEICFIQNLKEGVFPAREGCRTQRNNYVKKYGNFRIPAILLCV